MSWNSSDTVQNGLDSLPSIDTNELDDYIKSDGMMSDVSLSGTVAHGYDN